MSDNATADMVLRGERRWAVECADVLAFLRALPSQSVHCCVTSPPYFGLRDYGCKGQIGLEETPTAFVAKLVEVFGEVWRVLRDDATLWLNMGDSYCSSPPGCKGVSRSSALNGIGSQSYRERLERGCGTQRDKSKIPSIKPKDLIGIPWMVAFALRDAGWYLRSDIIWHKPNPMPETVTDRPSRQHEHVFLLSKKPTYFYDSVAVKTKSTASSTSRSKYPKNHPKGWHTEAVPISGGTSSNGAIRDEGGMANLRSVWRMSLRPFKGAHFACFPPALPEKCIKAGTSEKGCCPECGSPWKRVVKKERKATRPGRDTKVTAKMDGDTATAETNGWNRPNAIGNRDPQRHVTVTETTGWEPGCKCGREDTVSPIVLDPFGGAATTVLVAVRLGRRGICCDLNPEYVDMARKRIQEDVPLFD